ncbi:MAG: hypothetical protein ACRCY1_05395 [Leuconostoc suionicum]|uniref:hypothetical protein n=1 Tax=Leuconostoc suionicum TaxID=1511761 RepID=UPI003F2C4E36
MGLKDRFYELNNNRKRSKRFEMYNNVVKKTNEVSLYELSQKTGILLSQVEEDINSYIEEINSQEPLFKNRYYIDPSKYILHRKSWFECIKSWNSLKSTFYISLILPFLFLLLGITLLFNNKSPQENVAKSTASSTTKVPYPSSTEAPSSSSEENSSSTNSSVNDSSSNNTDTLKITKRRKDLKVDSGTGTYIGKSTSPEKISFKASDAKLTDGLYHIKWGHGIWSGSDPDYAYATIVINNDNNNLIQITEDDSQDINIKNSDIIHVQMFGKGTGDTLKFSR